MQIRIMKENENILGKIIKEKNLDLVAVIAEDKMVMIKDKKSLKCLFVDNSERLQFGNITQCESWSILNDKITIKTKHNEISFGFLLVKPNSNTIIK